MARGGPIERVLIEAGPDPDEHVAAVEEVFARWGFQVKAEPQYPLTGGPPTALAWAIYLALATPIVSFFNALGSEAGKDAYAALKSWVRDVIASRKKADGPGIIHVDPQEVSLKSPRTPRECYWPV